MRERGQRAREHGPQWGERSCVTPQIENKGLEFDDFACPS